MNTELLPGINWVGYVDWSVRDFHGYHTKRGSTYNSYLVKGAQKVAVIDAVKAPYVAKLLSNIEALIPLAQVNYVVCNHAEPDHSGGLPALMQACPNAVLLCNAKCKDALAHHYDTVNWKIEVVSDGQTVDLGGRTLQFFDTPMVHWPESMVTFVPEEGLLFSMDAFGQHFASSERFDDEADLSVVLQEAKTYYANIVLPYAMPVKAAIAKLGTLPIKMVAPSHGVIWRSHLSKILECYGAWRASQATPKVVVMFSTMWQSTRHMAEAIYAGACEVPNVEVKLFDLSTVSDTEVITELMDCAGFAIGSPTLNQGCMPRVAATMTYVRGLKPAGKKAVAFGSYGWASKGAEEIATYLTAMNAEQIVEPLTCRFAPDVSVLEKCREVGRMLGQAASACK